MPREKKQREISKEQEIDYRIQIDRLNPIFVSLKGEVESRGEDFGEIFQGYETLTSLRNLLAQAVEKDDLAALAQFDERLGALKKRIDAVQTALAELTELEKKDAESAKEIKTAEVVAEVWQKAETRTPEEILQLIGEAEQALERKKKEGQGKLRGAEKIADIKEQELTYDGDLVFLPDKGSAIVVGDTHGDESSIQDILNDTDFIARVENGEKLYLVFKGDYIDRGPKQLENIQALLDLYIQYPDNVILLGGNHEYEDGPFLLRPDGLRLKLLDKYPGNNGKDATELCKKYFELFTHLPFSLVAKNGLGAVHGGIPEDLVKGVGGLAALTLDQKTQIVWADPAVNDDGFAEQGRKPGVHKFGKKVFRNFQGTTGIRVLSRSHEPDYIGKPLTEGFLALFDGKLLTTFSTKGDRGLINPAYEEYDLERELADFTDADTSAVGPIQIRHIGDSRSHIRKPVGKKEEDTIESDSIVGVSGEESPGTSLAGVQSAAPEKVVASEAEEADLARVAAIIKDAVQDNQEGVVETEGAGVVPPESVMIIPDLLAEEPGLTDDDLPLLPEDDVDLLEEPPVEVEAKPEVESPRVLELQEEQKRLGEEMVEEFRRRGGEEDDEGERWFRQEEERHRRDTGSSSFGIFRGAGGPEDILMRETDRLFRLAGFRILDHAFLMADSSLFGKEWSLSKEKYIERIRKLVEIVKTFIQYSGDVVPKNPDDGFMTFPHIRLISGKSRLIRRECRSIEMRSLWTAHLNIIDDDYVEQLLRLKREFDEAYLAQEAKEKAGSGKRVSGGAEIPEVVQEEALVQAEETKPEPTLGVEEAVLGTTDEALPRVESPQILKLKEEQERLGEEMEKEFQRIVEEMEKTGCFDFWGPLLKSGYEKLTKGAGLENGHRGGYSDEYFTINRKNIPEMFPVGAISKYAWEKVEEQTGVHRLERDQASTGLFAANEFCDDGVVKGRQRFWSSDQNVQKAVNEVLKDYAVLTFAKGTTSLDGRGDKYKLDFIIPIKLAEKISVLMKASNAPSVIYNIINQFLKSKGIIADDTLRHFFPDQPYSVTVADNQVPISPETEAQMAEVVQKWKRFCETFEEVEKLRAEPAGKTTGSVEEIPGAVQEEALVSAGEAGADVDLHPAGASEGELLEKKGLPALVRENSERDIAIEKLNYFSQMLQSVRSRLDLNQDWLPVLEMLNNQRRNLIDLSKIFLINEDSHLVVSKEERDRYIEMVRTEKRLSAILAVGVLIREKCISEDGSAAGKVKLEEAVSLARAMIDGNETRKLLSPGGIWKLISPAISDKGLKLSPETGEGEKFIGELIKTTEKIQADFALLGSYFTCERMGVKELDLGIDNIRVSIDQDLDKNLLSLYYSAEFVDNESPTLALVDLYVNPADPTRVRAVVNDFSKKETELKQEIAEGPASEVLLAAKRAVEGMIARKSKKTGEIGLGELGRGQARAKQQYIREYINDLGANGRIELNSGAAFQPGKQRITGRQLTRRVDKLWEILKEHPDFTGTVYLDGGDEKTRGTMANLNLNLESVDWEKQVLEYLRKIEGKLDGTEEEEADDTEPVATAGVLETVTVPPHGDYIPPRPPESIAIELAERAASEKRQMVKEYIESIGKTKKIFAYTGTNFSLPMDELKRRIDLVGLKIGDRDLEIGLIAGDDLSLVVSKDRIALNIENKNFEKILDVLLGQISLPEVVTGRETGEEVETPGAEPPLAGAGATEAEKAGEIFKKRKARYERMIREGYMIDLYSVFADPGKKSALDAVVRGLLANERDVFANYFQKYLSTARGHSHGEMWRELGVEQGLIFVASLSAEYKQPEIYGFEELVAEFTQPGKSEKIMEQVMEGSSFGAKLYLRGKRKELQRMIPDLEARKFRIAEQKKRFLGIVGNFRSSDFSLKDDFENNLVKENNLALQFKEILANIGSHVADKESAQTLVESTIPNLLSLVKAIERHYKEIADEVEKRQEEIMKEKKLKPESEMVEEEEPEEEQTAPPVEPVREEPVTTVRSRAADERLEKLLAGVAHELHAEATEKRTPGFNLDEERTEEIEPEAEPEFEEEPEQTVEEEPVENRRLDFIPPYTPEPRRVGRVVEPDTRQEAGRAEGGEEKTPEQARRERKIKENTYIVLSRNIKKEMRQSFQRLEEAKARRNESYRTDAEREDAENNYKQERSEVMAELYIRARREFGQDQEQFERFVHYEIFNQIMVEGGEEEFKRDLKAGRVPEAKDKLNRFTNKWVGKASEVWKKVPKSVQGISSLAFYGVNFRIASGISLGTGSLVLTTLEIGGMALAGYLTKKYSGLLMGSLSRRGERKFVEKFDKRTSEVLEGRAWPRLKKDLEEKIKDASGEEIRQLLARHADEVGDYIRKRQGYGHGVREGGKNLGKALIIMVKTASTSAVGLTAKVLISLAL